MSHEIKAGDTVRVVRNVVSAHRPGRGAEELQPGDKIVVFEVVEKWAMRGMFTEDTPSFPAVIYQIGSAGCELTNEVDNKVYKGCNFIPLADVELDPACTCDIFLLMARGCRCGAFQREQREKAL